MSRLNMVRVRKTLMINRMQREVASNPALVAIASVGNMSSADKYKLRYSLADVGATLNFTKNTLKLKSMEALGGEIMGLAPLLRGKTILACGPAEAPMAKQLLSLACGRVQQRSRQLLERKAELIFCVGRRI